MIKKLLGAVMMIAAVCACAIGLAACGGDDGPTNGQYDGHEHVYTNYVYNNDGSCVDGTETARCDKCWREKHTRIKVGSAVGHHVYDDYVCIGCSGVDDDAPYTMDILTFTPITDDDDEVVGYSVKTNNSNGGYYVKIPAQYEGKPVISASYILMNSLYGISLPDGLLSIGKRAISFRGKGIIIPDSVTEIGDEAFSSCWALESITIPSSTVKIGKDAFRGCTRLESIVVAENNPFYHSAGNCLIETMRRVLITGANNSVIPADGSVTSIADNAFYNRKLTEINIPRAVESIGKNVFQSCYGLNKITVDADNPVFSGAGNCLVNVQSKTLLVGCPDSVIPADGSVERIGDYAFNRVVPTGFKIPDSVIEIGIDAFVVDWYDNNCKPDEYGIYYIDKWCVGQRLIFDENTEWQEGPDMYRPSAEITLRSGTVGIAKGHGDYGYSTLISCETLTLPASVKYINGGISACTFRYNGDMADWCGITGLGNINREYYDYENHNDKPVSVYIGDKELAGDVVIPDGVTEIKEGTFSGFKQISGITIPDSVTTIGERAFVDCSFTTATLPVFALAYLPSYMYGGNYESITLTSGTEITKETFKYITVKSITLPDTLISIGEEAFFHRSTLTSINIPKSVKDIGASAFGACDNLDDVYYEGSVGDWCSISGLQNLIKKDYSTWRTLHIDGKELEGELVIPDGVTEIKPYAFGGCNKITSVKLPSTLTVAIGWDALPYVEEATAPVIALDALSWNIKRLTINGGKLTAASVEQFSSLESLTLAEGLTGIGAGVFTVCGSASSITALTVPKTVTEIEVGAFAGLSSLEELSLPFVGAVNALTKTALPAAALKVLGAMFGTESYAGATAVEQVYAQGGATGLTMTFYIPSTLTKVTVDGDAFYDIAFGAFSNCTGLTEITVKNTQNIRDYAFYNCSALSEFDVTVEVGLIGGFAFNGCTSLERLDIADFDLDDPTSPNYPGNNRNMRQLMIRNGAFKNCTSLTEVTIPARVISMGGKIFEGCSSLTGVTFDDVEWLISVNGEEPTASAEYTFSQTPSENIDLLNAEFVTIVNKKAWLDNIQQ